MSSFTSETINPNEVASTNSNPQKPGIISDNHENNNALLQKLNSQKLLPSGSSFPVVQLSSGEKIPTGTIATSLFNLRKYDNLEAAIIAGKEREGEGDTEAVVERKEKEKEQRLVGEEMKLALPLLKMVGMFELFKPVEWCVGESAGRKLIGEEAVRQGF